MIYTIFGGVNGAGKSTLYTLLSEKEKALLGERINVDELVASKGDWRDEHLQIMASKQTVRRIKHCLNNGLPFNQETTFAGKSILNTIKTAKEKDFTVNLNYVYVDSPETAKKRVAERVKRGGHGVSDELIERRFVNSLENLKIAIPMCNKVIVYFNDSQEGLSHISTIINGQIMYESPHIHNFVKASLP